MRKILSAAKTDKIFPDSSDFSEKKNSHKCLLLQIIGRRFSVFRCGRNVINSSMEMDEILRVKHIYSGNKDINQWDTKVHKQG